jgi:hypothetical protein
MLFGKWLRFEKLVDGAGSVVDTRLLDWPFWLSTLTHRPSTDSGAVAQLVER